MADRRNASGVPLTYRGLSWSKIFDAMVGGTAATNGDLLTRASGLWNRKAVGSDGQFFKVLSGAPTWAASTAGGGGVGYVASAYHANDLVITNATTGSTYVDTDLILPLDVGTYRFLFQSFVLNNATPDMKFQITYTGSATANRWMLATIIEGNTSYFNGSTNSFLNTTYGVLTATAAHLSEVTGLVFTTTAGDLKLQTAQNSASATSVTYYRGSSAIVWQIA